MPFLVPGVDGKGHTNINDGQQTFRFWFKPYWTSASLASGAGPGVVATLLELDALGKNESANVWSLQISADGTTLSLLAQG